MNPDAQIANCGWGSGKTDSRCVCRCCGGNVPGGEWVVREGVESQMQMNNLCMAWHRATCHQTTATENMHVHSAAKCAVFSCSAPESHFDLKWCRVSV